MSLNDIYSYRIYHPGLNHEEYARMCELDAKEVEGTLTRSEEKELKALLAKMRKAGKRSSW